MFPEVEIDAKAFAVQVCSQKSGEFKGWDLAHEGTHTTDKTLLYTQKVSTL